MELEKFDWKYLTPQPIIGVDEVGRGCLAGPVYAAACILNEGFPYQHFTDSKKISPQRRKELSLEIIKNHRVSIGFATVEEIDDLNILNASLLAMKRAVLGLKAESGHILVDGSFCIPGLKGFVQTPLVKGDFRAEPIAAASIVAKVTRDEFITDYEGEFPQYGFAKHKGYSTKIHKEAIIQYGPTKYHRRTFSGVKEHL
ncbi:MAG: ribonuclease HII [Bdellovibrionales bacterium]|nr:ribonuclease HII [Bdellovibrionales bacterium]